jgi:hypothetical protein
MHELGIPCTCAFFGWHCTPVDRPFAALLTRKPCNTGARGRGAGRSYGMVTATWVSTSLACTELGLLRLPDSLGC